MTYLISTYLVCIDLQLSKRTYTSGTSNVEIITFTVMGMMMISISAPIPNIANIGQVPR